MSGVKKIAHEISVIDGIDYSYRKEGFCICTCQQAEETEIDSIFFYFVANSSEGYERFKEIGPSGIRSGMTQGDVISILGEPEITGGDFDDDVLGYQHPWIKYYPKPDVQLLVEIKDGKVWRGSVGTAFY